ncbi:MAG TPA: DUF4386 domain-containing protein [Anaerolineae bacterium]|nr:DUF4386 domain-containing protein [Anaerolineae bacterium]
MTNRIADISPRQAARVAGFLYLTIIIAGIFAEFFVRQSLIAPGDATATATNIMASEGLFRIGIAGDLIMIISDVALALVFYVLLKPVSNSLALLAAFFRLAQAAILGINLLNLFFVLQLLSGADYLTVFGADQLDALVLFFLNGHSIGYAIGLVLFGISLFILGYLVLKSGYFPRILGALLIVASLGYLIDSFASFLLPTYEAIFALVVFLPAFIGELSMCLWLLLKGVNIQQTQLRPSHAS